MLGRLGHWAALTVSAGYVFWWPIQRLVNFDFNEIAFGVPLIAWIIFFIDRNRYATVAVLCVILLGIREDMASMVAHPLKPLTILFDDGTRRFLWAALFFPLAQLPLLSPYVLLAAPILASRLLSDRPDT